MKAVGGTLVAGPTVLLSGCGPGDTVDRGLQFRSLHTAMEEAERLAALAIPPTLSTWSLAKTLSHCAQSIEFSVSGFPAMKSRLFRSTIGAAAFDVFAWRGRMSHDLSAPIPGAPPLAADGDIGVALTKLRAAIEIFEATQEPLQPHFAFGYLDKPDYELAHALHLANHFSAIPA